MDETTTTFSAQVQDFLIQELRSIRPTLPPTWPPSARFRADLALDSLDLVELLARIEQHWGLLVPDADLPQFVSLASSVDYVATRVGA